jgi:predicted Zn-dependent protease
MRLKELKSRVNRTVGGLKDTLHGRNRLIRRISIISGGSLLLLAFIFGGLFFRDMAVLVRNKLGLFEGASDNPVIKMAEDEYKRGYLENSALHYQNYLNDSEESKTRVDQILAFKRLTEIAVLRGQLQAALGYLEQWKELDPGNAQVVIYQLKIYYRREQFTRARALINQSGKQFRKVPEYIEAQSLYYLFMEQYDRALKILTTIPFKKREYSVHRKIIQCYIYLDQLTSCQVYIARIEPKIRSFGDRELRYELDLLKNMAYMLQGEYESVTGDLERMKFLSGNQAALMQILALKSRIIIDDEQGLKEFQPGSPEFDKLNPDYWLLLADYYLFRNRYENALDCFQSISTVRSLSSEELMTVADLHMKLGNYQQAATASELIMKEYNYRSPLIYKNLSAIHSGMGDYASELFYLKEGLVQHPADTDFNIRLAAAYSRNGEPRKALEWIRQARNGADRESPTYDRRLDLLYVLLLEESDNPVGEQELLDLREKGVPDPDYYFKLIDHYLKHNRTSDAGREIATVRKLPLTPGQDEILSCYRLLHAAQEGNTLEYNRLRSAIATSSNPDPYLTMNRAILLIEEGNFDAAHEILSSYQAPLLEPKLVAKAHYLRSIAYLYQGRLQMARKLVSRSLQIDPVSKKAHYLQNIIAHETGDSSDIY